LRRRPVEGLVPTTRLVLLWIVRLGEIWHRTSPTGRILTRRVHGFLRRCTTEGVILAAFLVLQRLVDAWHRKTQERWALSFRFRRTSARWTQGWKLLMRSLQNM
jgi:hypothetical protein